jgi:predicted esterase
VIAALAVALASAPAPRPLLVLLHGAGDDGQALFAAMRPLAEARGVDLLLARSGGPTWDLIGTDRPSGFGFSEAPRLPSGDRRRVDEAVAEYSTTHAVDAARVGLLGFSDGATYALSLATAEPSRYAFVAAIAPGGMLLGTARGAAARAQRIWIAHGARDRRFSAPMSQRLCRDLAATGRRAGFYSFEGGHEVPLAVVEAALDRFVGKVPLEADCGK